MTKLSEESSANRASFSFHTTAEGRGFLRYCYARYLDCLKSKHANRAPSHGKIGMVVADQIKDQEAEHNRTGQALRRWLEDGKAEIWHGNMPATIRICQRLETLMSEEPKVLQIMEDRVAGIKRARFLAGLTDFFLPNKLPYVSAITRQKLKEYSGVYTIWSYAENDRWEPYFYQTDTHCRLELHEELPILSIQEFDLVTIDGREIVKNRKVGFLLLDDQSTVFRYLINYRNPNVRWMEVLTQNSLPDLPIFSASDNRFDARVFGINEDAQLGAAESRKSLNVLGRSLNNDLLFNRSNESTANAINELIASIQWDIMI
jgi:hypothetical protein